MRYLLRFAATQQYAKYLTVQLPESDKLLPATAFLLQYISLLPESLLPNPAPHGDTEPQRTGRFPKVVRRVPRGIASTDLVTYFFISVLINQQGPLIGEKLPMSVLATEYAQADPTYVVKTTVRLMNS